MSSYTRQQLESYLGTIEIVSGSVLDVGGAQLSIKDRVKTFTPESYDILDIPKPHKGGLENVDIVWDINHRITEKKEIEKTYDTIFCIEVMEYVWNPMTVLHNLYELMNVGGTLYISFHFVYPVHEPIKEDTLRYTKRGAMRMIEHAGFDVEEVTPRLCNTHGSYARFFTEEAMRGTRDIAVNHEEVGCIIRAIKK